MIDRWSDDLDSLRRRLGDLIDDARFGEQHREIAAEALEELAVAVEELQTQNNELVAGRADLELERRRFRDLFETMPDGYAITDANGVVTEANATLCELLGSDRTKLIGRPLASHIAPDHQRAFYNLINRVNRTVDHGTLTLNLDITDHQLVPVNLRATTTPNEAGGDHSIRWLIHDRRRELAAADLRDSEERLRSSSTPPTSVSCCPTPMARSSSRTVRGRSRVRGLRPRSRRLDVALTGPDRRSSPGRGPARRGERRGTLGSRSAIGHHAGRKRPAGSITASFPSVKSTEAISAVVSTFTDATAEQLALTELRRNRDFMAATLDTVAAIVIVRRPCRSHSTLQPHGGDHHRLDVRRNDRARASSMWCSRPRATPTRRRILANAATGHHVPSEHDWLRTDRAIAGCRGRPPSSTPPTAVSRP